MQYRFQRQTRKAPRNLVVRIKTHAHKHPPTHLKRCIISYIIDAYDIVKRKTKKTARARVCVFVDAMISK